MDTQNMLLMLQIIVPAVIAILGWFALRHLSLSARVDSLEARYAVEISGLQRRLDGIERKLDDLNEWLRNERN